MTSTLRNWLRRARRSKIDFPVFSRTPGGRKPPGGSCCSCAGTCRRMPSCRHGRAPNPCKEESRGLCPQQAPSRKGPDDKAANKPVTVVPQRLPKILPHTEIAETFWTIRKNLSTPANSNIHRPAQNRPAPKPAQGGQLFVGFLPASPFRGDIVIAQFQQRSDLFIGDGAIKQYRDPVGFVHVICGQKAPFCQQ